MSVARTAERVGVFGGTFDPPHTGHLIAAQATFEALDLDRLLFVPALRSPHKGADPVAAPELRLRMLEVSIAEDDRFAVDPRELDRPAPSYSVDTLEALGGDAVTLLLIIGADQWAALGRWHEAERIAELADVGVMTRAGESPGDTDPGFGAGATPSFVTVAVPRIDISSSMIRERRRRGLPIRYLVPEPVRRIIEREDLYS